MSAHDATNELIQLLSEGPTALEGAPVMTFEPEPESVTSGEYTAEHGTVFSWVAWPVSSGFVLHMTHPTDPTMDVTHGRYVPVTVGEIRTSNSRVAEILREAYAVGFDPNHYRPRPRH